MPPTRKDAGVLTPCVADAPAQPKEEVRITASLLQAARIRTLSSGPWDTLVHPSARPLRQKRINRSPPVGRA